MLFIHLFICIFFVCLCVRTAEWPPLLPSPRSMYSRSEIVMIDKGNESVWGRERGECVPTCVCVRRNSNQGVCFVSFSLAGRQSKGVWIFTWRYLRKESILLRHWYTYSSIFKRWMKLFVCRQASGQAEVPVNSLSIETASYLGRYMLHNYDNWRASSKGNRQTTGHEKSFIQLSTSVKSQLHCLQWDRIRFQNGAYN